MTLFSYVIIKTSGNSLENVGFATNIIYLFFE